MQVMLESMLALLTIFLHIGGDLDHSLSLGQLHISLIVNILEVKVVLTGTFPAVDGACLSRSPSRLSSKH